MTCWTLSLRITWFYYRPTVTYKNNLISHTTYKRHWIACDSISTSSCISTSLLVFCYSIFFLYSFHASAHFVFFACLVDTAEIGRYIKFSSLKWTMHRNTFSSWAPRASPPHPWPGFGTCLWSFNLLFLKSCNICWLAQLTWIHGSGAKPLEAECVSIYPFKLEMKIKCISLLPIFDHIYLVTGKAFYFLDVYH